MDDQEKAGKMAAELLAYGKGLLKENEKLLDITNKIEDKLREMGGKPAFPAQISLNDVAAHSCPESDDLIIKKGDLVKLDVGVHVNGYLGDNACTVSFDSNDELIEASDEALKVATDLMRPGITLNEIGKNVEEVIVSKGFQPIRNLSGHEVSRYDLHAGLTVPNHANGDETELKEGQVFAVEPFATTGDGWIKDGQPSGIYKLVMPKNVRSGREVLNFVIENYSTLPFARKWLVKKFPGFKLNFGLRVLENEEILMHYKQLIEKTEGIVSQSENTIKVKDKPVILTKV